VDLEARDVPTDLQPTTTLSIQRLTNLIALQREPNGVENDWGQRAKGGGIGVAPRLSRVGIIRCHCSTQPGLSKSWPPSSRSLGSQREDHEGDDKMTYLAGGA